MPRHEPHAALFDGEHPGRVAVDEIRSPRAAETHVGRGAVAGPAHLVPRAELNRGGVEEPETACGVARGAAPRGRAIGARELDPGVADAQDGAHVVPVASMGVAVEHHGITHRVAPEVGRLGACEMPVDEALDDERRPVERSLQRKPLAYARMGLAADR